MKAQIRHFAIATMIAVACSWSTAVKAQVSVSADLVSSYVWRGSLCSQGVNIQPSLSYTKNNFEIGSWGSVDFFGYKEVDLYASYSIGGFSFGITDYYWASGARYFSYKNAETAHLFEGNLAYTISEEFPLSIAVNTMFYGDDKKPDESGDQNFSTYIELGYSWKFLSAAVGVTPDEGLYGDGFGVCNVSLTASKEIAISEQFALPMSASLIVNPQAEDIHLVLGISF